MLRRISAVSAFTAMCSSMARQQQRQIAVTSEQQNILAHNQKHKGFKSNVWFEVEDEYWYKGVTRVKKGELPTEVPIRKRFEVYNLDQLDGEFPAPPISAIDKELNYTNKKPWTDEQLKDLSRVKKNRDFASQYWISNGYLGRKGHDFEHVKPKDKEQPTTLFYEVSSKLLNTDQFEDANMMRMHPIAGGTARAYSMAAPTTKLLRDDVNKRGFATGIYFSESQLKTLNLAKADGATGISIEIQPSGKNVAGFMLYNLDEVVDGENWCKQLQRFPVDKPTYLLRGTEVGPNVVPKIEAVGRKWKSNYWVSGKDLEFAKKKAKDSATAVYYGKTREPTVFYNVEELQNPSLGYESIGKYVYVPTGRF